MAEDGFSWSDITKTDLKTKLGISSLLSASALGISLTSHPVGFVKAVVIEWFLGGIITMFGLFGAEILDLWNLLSGVVGGTVDAAIPGALIADIPLDLISSLSSTFTGVAESLGPLAPFAMIIMWAITVLLAVGFLWALWLIIKSLTTL